MLNTHTKGVFIGVGAVLSGLPTFLIVRILKHSNAWTQLALRTPFYIVVIGTVAAIYWRSFSRAKFVLSQMTAIDLFACIFVAGQSIAIVVSLLLTTVANVALIINTSPIFCVLLDRFVLKEKIESRTSVMVVLGLVAVGVIVGGDTTADAAHMKGNIVALLNPISWACYWCINRKFAKKDSTTTKKVELTKPIDKFDKIFCYQLLSALLCGLVGAAGGIEKKTVRELDWPWYFLYGGVCLPICVMLFSLAPAYISTAEMGCIKMLETVLAPLIIFAYEGEVPNVATYIGGSLLITTLLGHSLATIFAEKKKPTEDTEAVHVNDTATVQISDLTDALTQTQPELAKQ